jgi:succinate dehydrogenase / fumarate reductase, cytochrome b subunit
MSNTVVRYASITKKITMSIIGLFLAVFLVVHLTINLLLLKSDGGEAFGAAAEFMGTNIFIVIFEKVLFLAFVLHILLGIFLWWYNNNARPVKYVKANVSKASPGSKFMIHTGIIIFIFLILHFLHFYFVKIGIVPVPEGAHGPHDFYNMAINLFTNPLYSFIYILSFIGLGIHMNHAFQSAFQSLGMEHSKYTPIIKLISTAYAILIVIGFSIIPIFFMLTKN